MFGALALFGAVSGADGAALKPKALVIMLDGTRADAVENLCAPNLRMLRDGKWQPGYKGNWSLTASTIMDAITVSGPNHTAIATGVTGKKSTLKGNHKCTTDFKKWPSWLVRLINAQPDKKAFFMFSWGWDKQISPDPRIKFVHGKDAANAENMPKILAAADAPDAVMWYIDYPDHGGHGFGFYPYATGYMHYVHLADAAIGGALKAIASRPTFKDEDWLVIVTADHGGYWRTHGTWGGHCETIPFIMAGRNVAQGRIPGIPHNYDAAPTALKHFGIDASGMDLDGKALPGVAVADAVHALKDGLAAYFPFDGKTPVNAADGAVAPELFGKASVAARGEFLGGCLRVAAATNVFSGLRLKGSEKLQFENGKEFAFAMWVRMPYQQKGDSVIVANKNWHSGGNPGVLITGRKQIQSKVGGVCFNAGLSGARKRIDIGPFDIEFGKWTFYAATRGPDGVLNFYQGGRDGFLYRNALDATDVILSTGLPFCIGQDGTGKYGAPFEGDVDDFALWTRSLSHDDVRKIYEAGRKGISLGELL